MISRATNRPAFPVEIQRPAESISAHHRGLIGMFTEGAR